MQCVSKVNNESAHSPPGILEVKKKGKKGFSMMP